MAAAEPAKAAAPAKGAAPAKAAPVKEAAAVAPKKKSKMMLIIIIAVVVLAGGGGAAWFFMKPNPNAKTEAPKVVHTPAIYYKFDPPFVVNFGAEGSARYLQVTLEAMSRDQMVVDLMKANDPAIRNDLVLLLSGQDYATLVKPEGKEALRNSILAVIRRVIAKEGGDDAKVEGVYFTSFVIQ